MLNILGNHKTVTLFLFLQMTYVCLNMKNPNTIYHICSKLDWDNQASNDFYIHPSLKLEGFIHCSTKTQIDGVLNRYFKGVENLVILTIDVNLLTSKLVFEKSTNNELFPHVYDVINRDSIISFETIQA